MFINSLIFSFIFGVVIVFTLKEFYLLLGSMIFMGFFWSLMLPFIEVIALRDIGKNDYGKARLFGSIGFTITALLIGQIGMSQDILIFVYLLGILLTSLSGFLLYKYITDNKKTKTTGLKTNHPINIWLALFLVQVGFGAFYNFFTIFVAEHNISLSTITYLWAFGVIAEIAMFGFQNKIMHFNLLFLIKISIFLTIVRWLLIDFYPDNLNMLYASQSIHAFSLALLHTASISFINNYYNANPLAQQFYLGITFGLGMFVGSIVAGLLYSEHIFLYMAIITLFAFVLILNKNETAKL
jgi:PPP family 3-phenylpropionic acid transporter